MRAVVPPTGTKPDSATVLGYLATLPDHARERLDQHFRGAGKSLREIEQFHRQAAGQVTPEQVRADRAARADAGDAARAAMTGSGAAPGLAALKKNPMADAEHLTAAAQAAPASAKRFLETAAANLHDQHDDEKQSRSHTLRRLASSYAEAERMDPAAAEHVAGVMAQYGVSREHKPGDVVPFDGARHQSGAAVSTGAAVRVTAPALTATSPDGRPYLLRPAQVEPVPLATAAAPAAGGGGSEPPKVPPVASGAGDGPKEPVPIKGQSDSQVAFANKVRSQHLDAIQKRLAAVGGDTSPQGEREGKALKHLRELLASTESARVILDIGLNNRQQPASLNDMIRGLFAPPDENYTSHLTPTHVFIGLAARKHGLSVPTLLTEDQAKDFVEW